MNKDNQRLAGLCIAFFVLFFAFFAAQNQVAPTLKESGTASLGLLYLSFAITSAITPSFLNYISTQSNSLRAETISLIVGSALYSPFLFACSIGHQYQYLWIQLLTSCTLGIGAGLLWVAQGSLLTASTVESNRGRWSGIFWASFMCGNAAGNYATYFVLNKTTISKAFIILGCVSAFSTLIFLFFVKPRTIANSMLMKKEKERLLGNRDSALLLSAATAATATTATATTATAATTATTATTTTTLMGDLQLLAAAAFKTRQVSSLLPLLLFIGCENSFWGGVFPDIISKIHGKNTVSLVSGILATSDIVSSLITGLIIDMKGIYNVKYILSIGLLVFFIGSSLVWLERYMDDFNSNINPGNSPNKTEGRTPFPTPSSKAIQNVSSMWLVNGAAICMGLGDGICNTVAITRLQVLSVRYQLLSKRTAFQLFQCVNVAMTSITFAVLTLTSVIDDGADETSFISKNIVWILLDSLILVSMFFLFFSPRETYADFGMNEG
jgi:hypothetical protein